VIAHSALTKFTDAAQLNAYIRAAMPYWNPGSLTEEESWRITAFLLRENSFWDGSTELNASNAADIKIAGGVPTAVLTPQQAQVPARSGAVIGIGLIVVVALVLALMFVLKKSKNTTTI
jgi:hypothetical protein